MLFRSKFLVEYSRVNSHEEKQEGSVRLSKPGTYILQFDNTYSRSKSKTIHYCITLKSMEIPSTNGTLGKVQKKKCSIGHVTLNTDDDDVRDGHAHDSNNDDKQTLVATEPKPGIGIANGYAIKELFKQKMSRYSDQP